MRTTKKLLAFLLCLSMIPCAFLTVFAEEGTTSILYEKTFDGSLNSLADAGLAVNASQSSFRTKISDEGYLAVSQTGTGYSNIVFSEDVIKGAKDYTVQVTFRWTDPTTYDTARFNLNGGGYVIGKASVQTSHTNTRYNSPFTSGKTGTSQIETYGELNANVVSAWKPVEFYGDYVPGNWVTTTLQVKDGKMGKLTLSVAGVDTVTFDKPITATTVPEGNPFIRLGATFGLEIYDLRVAEGVDVDMNTPTLPARFTPSDTSVDNGKVLYYQKFDKAFDLSNVSDTGLTVYDTVSDRVYIGDDGYLNSNNIGHANDYNNMMLLRNVLPEGLATYTVELVFRYPDSTSKNNGGVNIGFAENGANNVKLGIYLRYKFSSQFDNVASAIDPDVAAAWLPDGTGPGNWVTLKASVKDGCLYNVSVAVEDSNSGTQYMWSTDSPEYQNFLPHDGNIIIRQGPASVQYSSIRVVEGEGYTEYKGEYASKSYSGHEDHLAYAVDVIGHQAALVCVDGMYSVRIIGKIDSYLYDAAGFTVTAKTTKGNFDVSSPVTVVFKELNAKSDEGLIKVTAEEYGANFLMALTIGDIDIQYGEVKFEITAYAVRGDKTFYGRTVSITPEIPD